jgi:histidinol-phosphatase
VDDETDLALALRLADEADAITRAAFTGQAVEHRTKHDGSPVSDADVAVEQRIVDVLAAERPGDGLLGEEVGALGLTAGGRRWILDGIDGTVLFVAGLAGWATEIALEVDGEPVVGVCTCPSLGLRWWAGRGQGAWRWAQPGVPDGGARLAVDPTAELARTRYTAIPPLDALAPPGLLLAQRLGNAAADYVPPTEHGALLVAEGRAGVCLQTGGGPWDFAALAVIVTEAGGRFSDLAGRPDIYGGGPAVFSNGHVHDAALAALGGDRVVP